MSYQSAVPLHDFPIPMAPPPTAPSAPPHTFQHNPPPPLTPSAPPEDVSKLLVEQGFSLGLIRALWINKDAFAQSTWVVDNSGSMQTRDGHRIVTTTPTARSSNTSGIPLKLVECSRWTELQQTVEYHAQLASVLRTPTTFRLLNDPGRVCGPQIFHISAVSTSSSSMTMLDEELSVAISTMQNTQPGGVTPLTLHIQAIRQEIISRMQQGTMNGAKVAVVLATDGLPSDAMGYSNASVKQEFVSALRSLEGLPVWIVVRLCTDEEDVVQYWNDLDAQLELSLEVLDDFASEGQEVHKTNPWLTYGLPLHRMREMGFHHIVFDLLDERKLSRDEVRDFLRLLLGPFEAPDPEGDWKGFADVIERLVKKERLQWNPVHKKVMPWIDMRQLHKQYGPPSGLFGLW